MAIQRLDERVVAKIAAGEVIERPASVVKELLENAIDAGATQITIEITGNGQRFMRISDDGCGIPNDEMELAVMRHATSKLRTVEDLETIDTLGFRGEALASIAAVSHLTLLSRPQHGLTGTQLRIEGGEVRHNQAVGAPAGPVLTIEHLFFNTPARLKFLKSDQTERRQITNVVMNYALAYPQVRFSLAQDGREILYTNGTGELSDALINLFNVDEFRQMIAVQGEENLQTGGAVQIWGYTSAPDFSRTDRSRILLFVNGRAIQDTKLSYAVIQAYHTFLMTGRYPVAVLMIAIPPSEVDVNVHPAKAEVRFSDPSLVFTAIQRAVRRALIEEASPHTDMRGGRFDPVASTLADAPSQVSLNLPLEESGQSARQRDLYGNQHALKLNATAEAQDDLTAIPEGPDAPIKPRTLPMLRVVGQVSAAYIVAEGPAGMYLVDQHAAHERILYEQFMAAYHRQESMTQQVLAGQTVQLSPLDARLIEENLSLLESIGLQLEPFGPKTFTVRSVPAMLADANPQALLASIVSDLAQGVNPGEQSIEDKIIRRVCKQAAVKAGQVLSMDEMQRLIRQLERCESPHTFPHGRPTILHMSADHLAREFGRAGSR
jgi:DNA mismatch repair protein MutL